MKVIKPDYYMNDLIDECISRFLDTFVLLQDTPDYLPQVVLDKIILGVSKEFNRKWKRLRKFDKRIPRKGIDKETFFKMFGQPKPLTTPESQSKELSPETITTKEVANNVKE